MSILPVINMVGDHSLYMLTSRPETMPLKAKIQCSRLYSLGTVLIEVIYGRETHHRVNGSAISQLLLGSDCKRCEGREKGRKLWFSDPFFPSISFS